MTMREQLVVVLVMAGLVVAAALLSSPEPRWVLRLRCTDVNRQVVDVVTQADLSGLSGRSEAWACTDRGWIRTVASER